MEAARSSETLVFYHSTTRRYNPIAVKTSNLLYSGNLTSDINICHSQRPDLFWVLSNGYRGSFWGGGEATGREANYSPPSNAEG